MTHLSSSQDGAQQLLRLQGIRTLKGTAGSDWISSSMKILRESLLSSPRISSSGPAPLFASKQQLGFLQVLINMVAFTDGQKAVLQAPSAAGALDLIALLVDPPTGAPKTPSQILEASLLLLRNLCYSPDAKAHLLAHPSLLSSCLAQIERAAEAPKASSLASSALYALVYQGEKVKAAVRRLPNALERLTVIKCTCEFRLERGRLQQDQERMLKVTLDNMMGLIEAMTLTQTAFQAKQWKKI